MNQPLVSIICLCHNQAPYVQEALQSVMDQTYNNVELIVVDDGSRDGSTEVINEFLNSYPDVQFIAIKENIGNCAAFNRGWRASKGEFLIDLAADDVLLPERVEVGIKQFEETKAGVHFSDALLMDESGMVLGHHNERFTEPIPEGDLYTDLVSRYLICPPTMMFRKEVIEALDGYDETLAFEDYDFWVRSSREFDYAFSDQVLVKKRILKNSHGRSQYKFLNSHQQSTLKVCKKILAMNRTEEEGRALKKRCWYEIRQCIKKGNLGLIPDYLSIVSKS
ncbi:MAG: glycosyltransferase [Cytophagales bacterium]|nr:glycosyltransferase [Cytophagales bacterium]